MTVQVLVATMNQCDYKLLKKMNIQTDAIIGNQGDKNEIAEFEFNNRHIKWLSFNERGVGLNRNNILMRATEEIVLFADDDVVYIDGYESIILDFYDKHPDADVVVFNLQMQRRNGERCERVTREGRLSRKSALKYGTACISAKREKLRYLNIYFHLDFGGGTKYSSGEDSIFLQDCIKKKLNVYASKSMIGSLNQGVSTWFKGYNDKFFFDKGVLFSTIFPNFCIPFAFAHCLKHRLVYSEYGWLNAYKMMKKGVKEIRKIHS